MQQDGLVSEQRREALGQAQPWHRRPLRHKEAFLLFQEGKFKLGLFI